MRGTIGLKMTSQKVRPWLGHLAATARSSPPRAAGHQQLTTGRPRRPPEARRRPLGLQGTFLGSYDRYRNNKSDTSSDSNTSKRCWQR